MLVLKCNCKRLELKCLVAGVLSGPGVLGSSRENQAESGKETALAKKAMGGVSHSVHF